MADAVTTTELVEQEEFWIVQAWGITGGITPQWFGPDFGGDNTRRWECMWAAPGRLRWKSYISGFRFSSAFDTLEHAREAVKTCEWWDVQNFPDDRYVYRIVHHRASWEEVK